MYSLIFLLVAQLPTGPLPLRYREPNGYLQSLLKTLDVPLSSQTLVFSKTSAQSHLIFPSAPRALFFNDYVYIGWVRGSDFLEISYADPDKGALFYLMEQDPATKPRLVPKDNCVQCHESSRTYGIPGHLMRSVHPQTTGHPYTDRGSYSTDDTSPFSERWGGWYVTSSTPLKFPHMGNTIFPTIEDPKPLGRFDAPTWPTNTSDVVALMVLAHQVAAHNHLSYLDHESRSALSLQHTMNTMDQKPDIVTNWSASTQRRIARVIESTIRYLTFADEMPFPQSIRGDSNFANDFQKRGPLRRFNCDTRLFEYPLSYLIYSKSIDRLDPVVKQRFLARLEQVLTEEAGQKDYARLSPAKAREAWRIYSKSKL